MAKTSAGGGGSVEKGSFTSETTVEEGLELVGSDQFATWPSFYVVPEGIDVSSKVRREVEVAKNITLAKFNDIRDWVLLRNSLDNGVSLNEFLDSRTSSPAIATADEWLQIEQWDQLRKSYGEIINKDLQFDDENRPLGLADWKYYRGDFEVQSSKYGDQPLESALKVQMDSVQGMRLNKYVDVFTTIGLCF